MVSFEDKGLVPPGSVEGPVGRRSSGAAPWLRENRTIYALQHAGWRKGEEQFQNRWSAQIQGGPGATDEELDAVSAVILAAPDLLAALQGAIGALEFSQDFHRDLGNEEQAFVADRLDAARAAIAKATGATS